MKNINEIIDKKFDKRFDISAELQEKLLNISIVYSKKSDAWRYWLVAASILLLLSFHIVNFGKEDQQNEDEIVEVYNENWNNQL
jgi:hypothetical protein